jgi:pimeloyl-ACP methyl ester carboxylesterase
LDDLKSPEFGEAMESGGPPTVTFGPFQLDLARRRLTRAGVETPLGERALDVLCALVAADGEVVSKRDLLAKVWPEVTVEENNLQVQVYALRRALGEDGDARGYIRTASGRGYRFVGDAAPSVAPAVPAQDIRYARGRDGAHLAYAMAGEGPPLVRAPLWMSHVEHDWKTSIWSGLLAALAGSHALLRYDGRGMGLSDRDAPISFDAAVEDLEAVVYAAGLERFALLGISQGAAVSLAFAARRPERVSKLVLAGGYARGRLVVAPESAAALEATKTLVREGWGRDNPAFRQIFTSLGFPEATATQMHELNELQRISATGEAAARIMDMQAHIDVSADLARIRCPTLVLHSRDDAWVPVERSREIARAVAGARFREIAGANHVVLPQSPQFPDYVGRILAFLAEPG